MKTLFIADWHIKLKTKGIPDTWAINRFNILVLEIYKVIQEENIEQLVLGGDTFDRLPTLEELALFFGFIENINIPTYIIEGNHEATRKGETFLKVINTLVKNPLVHFILEFKTINGIDYIPYCKLKEWTTNPESFNSNILVTHVRGEIPPHVKPEIDLSLFDRWDVVFAGDLHSHSNSQRNIVYPGSPVTTSFHRTLVDTGAVIFDTTSPKDWKWIKFNVPQLLRKTIQAGEEMPASTFHHTVYEVEGDMSELSKVENTDLLDKKIIKRSTEASLIITPEMTLTEELVEYLRYILELPEETIEDLVGIFNDNISKITLE